MQDKPLAAISREGFLPGERLFLAAHKQGQLSGLSFAVKDNIDIQGAVTGAGNPHWASTHAPATDSAPLVTRLLIAGADMLGKTITEELAFSLIGDNNHFGAPLNGATPERFSGGSSSGSASVVSRGEADFALGTDTAGSIRVPASNCRLFGFRPSHGRLDMQGILPLAASFDVPGWMARDISVLQRVGEVLLPEDSAGQSAYERCFFFEPALQLLDDEYANLYRELIASPTFSLARHFGKTGLWPEQLDQLTEAFRVLQAQEAWQAHGSWVSQAPKNALADDIRQRFFAGEQVSDHSIELATRMRQRLIKEFDELMDHWGVIALPTVTEPALKISASEKQKHAYRKSLIRMTCLSSLTGLPEISLPIVSGPDYYLGLSLIGRRGTDRALLDFARHFFNNYLEKG